MMFPLWVQVLALKFYWWRQFCLDADFWCSLSWSLVTSPNQGSSGHYVREEVNSTPWVSSCSNVISEWPRSQSASAPEPFQCTVCTFANAPCASSCFTSLSSKYTDSTCTRLDNLHLVCQTMMLCVAKGVFVCTVCSVVTMPLLLVVFSNSDQLLALPMSASEWTLAPPLLAILCPCQLLGGYPLLAMLRSSWTSLHHVQYMPKQTCFLVSSLESIFW